ncbi:MAG: pilus assembly protein PilM [Marinicella sp.]
MQLLGRKKIQLVGVDVSSSAVKILQLSGSMDNLKVERYAVEPLAANAVVDNNIAEVDMVSAAISKAFNKAGVKIKGAATAVSGSSVITKIIQMPSDLSDEELEVQLELDANQFIPYPIEEVSLDFCILGPAEGNKDVNNVLIASSRSENVDVFLEAFQGAGLELKVVDVEAFAIERCFNLVKAEYGIDDDEVVALFDIGANTMTMHAMHKKTGIYSREQSFGGRQLTEEIMQRYGLSYEEAGLAKRQGGLPESYETEVLQSFKDTLVQQISRALQFFFSATEFGNVDRILLGGGCAAIVEIDALVEDQIGVPTEVINPVRNFKLSSKVSREALEADSPALMSVVGLALRNFD